MDKPKTYCAYINSLGENEYSVHREYHDTQYGFPMKSDDELFGRLILEINQAGLSWTTILNKQDSFRKAYHSFSVKKIASYRESDFIRLMNDAGIIRNRLKINAAIENAKTILKIQKEYGSFKNWLDSHHPLKREEWTVLFRKNFRFTGGEIVNEFLMSTGYLSGSHEKTCPVYKKILLLKPAWSRK
ncbi:MAG: DNA-3-methyladenine glycosylase I [Ignavibacteria bacterium]|nr:DNA-3-methyladenine glycosylase I [Ignavibacteria bacterium]